MIHFAQTTAFSAALLQAAARLDAGQRRGAEHRGGRRHPLAAQGASVRRPLRRPGRRRRRPRSRVPRPGPRRFLEPERDRHPARLPLGVGRRRRHRRQGRRGAGARRRPRRRTPQRKAQLLAAAREWYAAGKAAGRSTPRLPGTGGFYFFRTFKSSLAAGAAALFRSHRRDRLPRRRQDLPADLGASATSCSRPATWRRSPPPTSAACSARRRSATPPRAPRAAASCATPPRSTARLRAPERLRARLLLPVGDDRRERAPAASRRRSPARGPASAAAARSRRARATTCSAATPGARASSSASARTARSSPHHWASVFPPHRGLPQGAVVGGPAPRDQIIAEARSSGSSSAARCGAFNSDIAYEDHRPDYVTSEPAIDYSATAILLLAAL